MVNNTLDVIGGFFKQSYPCSTGVTPNKKNLLDAGLDLVSTMQGKIAPGDRQLIPTGIAVEILPGYVGLVKARSGLAVKHGIIVGAGVIDSGYRGEVKVLLFNMGKEWFQYNPGDRIAQLLTVPINLGLYTEVEYLSDTERGTNGFGSSGK
jgi:dUTP pyrophosphatase